MFLFYACHVLLVVLLSAIFHYILGAIFRFLVIALSMDTVELHLLRPLYALVDTVHDLGYWKSIRVLLALLAYLWCLCYIFLAGAVVLFLVTAILVLTERHDLLLYL